MICACRCHCRQCCLRCRAGKGLVRVYLVPTCVAFCDMLLTPRETHRFCVGMGFVHIAVHRHVASTHWVRYLDMSAANLNVLTRGDVELLLPRRSQRCRAFGRFVWCLSKMIGNEKLLFSGPCSSTKRCLLPDIAFAYVYFHSDAR